MSDMRFIILGVALIFVGVIVLGAFGHEYQAARCIHGWSSIDDTEWNIRY